MTMIGRSSFIHFQDQLLSTAHCCRVAHWNLLLPSCELVPVFSLIETPEVIDTFRLKEERSTLTQISVVSVHGHQASRQKWHGGRAWRKRDAHITLARKCIK